MTPAKQQLLAFKAKISELKQQLNAIEKEVEEKLKKEEWQERRRWARGGRRSNWTRSGWRGRWQQEYSKPDGHNLERKIATGASYRSSRRSPTPTLNFLTIATIFAFFFFLTGSAEVANVHAGTSGSPTAIIQLSTAGLIPDVSGEFHPNFSNSGSEHKPTAKLAGKSAHVREASAHCFPVGRWKPCQTELNVDVQQKKERKAEEMRSEEEEEKTNDENPKKAEEEEMKKEADEANKAEEEKTDEGKKAEDAKQAEEPINAEERKAEDEEEKAEEKKADEPKKAEEKKTEEGRAEKLDGTREPTGKSEKKTPATVNCQQ